MKTKEEQAVMKKIRAGYKETELQRKAWLADATRNGELKELEREAKRHKTHLFWQPWQTMPLESLKTFYVVVFKKTNEPYIDVCNHSPYCYESLSKARSAIKHFIYDCGILGLTTYKVVIP